MSLAPDWARRADRLPPRRASCSGSRRAVPAGIHAQPPLGVRRLRPMSRLHARELAVATLAASRAGGRVMDATLAELLGAATASDRTEDDRTEDDATRRRILDAALAEAASVGHRPPDGRGRRAPLAARADDASIGASRSRDDLVRALVLRETQRFLAAVAAGIERARDPQRRRGRGVHRRRRVRARSTRCCRAVRRDRAGRADRRWPPPRRSRALDGQRLHRPPDPR